MGRESGSDQEKVQEPGAKLTPSKGTTLAKMEDRSARDESSLIPEIAEVLEREQSQTINFNTLVLQVVAKSATSKESVDASRELLQLNREFESHALESFKERRDAIIEAKQRDPDEIDRRDNNRVRRYLKVLIAMCAVLSLGGGVSIAYLGGNLVVTVGLLSIAALSVALMGPLASGESVSVGDVVKIFNAVKPGGISANDGVEKREEKGQRRNQR